MPEVVDDATKRLQKLEAAAERARHTLAEVKATAGATISMHDLDLATTGMSPQSRIETKLALVRAGKVEGTVDVNPWRAPPKYTEVLATQRQQSGTPGFVGHISGASTNDAPIRVDDMLLIEMRKFGITNAEGADGRTLSQQQYDRLVGGKDPMTKAFLVSTMRSAGILPIAA